METKPTKSETPQTYKLSLRLGLWWLMIDEQKSFLKMLFYSDSLSHSDLYKNMIKYICL